MARYIHCTVRGRLGGVVRKHVGGKGFLYPGNSEELQRESNLHINSFRRGHFTTLLSSWWGCRLDSGREGGVQTSNLSMDKDIGNLFVIRFCIYKKYRVLAARLEFYSMLKIVAPACWAPFSFFRSTWLSVTSFPKQRGSWLWSRLFSCLPPPAGRKEKYSMLGSARLSGGASSSSGASPEGTVSSGEKTSFCPLRYGECGQFNRS